MARAVHLTPNEGTDAEVLVTAARLAGYPIEATQEIASDGQPLHAVIVDTRSNAGAIHLLKELSKLYARNPEILALGATLARTGCMKYQARAELQGATTFSLDDMHEWTARQIHTYVKANIRYLEEDEEVFRSPMVTVRYGLGDCDEHATLVASLGSAAGLRVRMRAMGRRLGEISHVVSQAFHHGRWHYVETTLDAEYGEEPFAAAERLTAARPDLTGNVLETSEE